MHHVNVCTLRVNLPLSAALISKIFWKAWPDILKEMPKLRRLTCTLYFSHLQKNTRTCKRNLCVNFPWKVNTLYRLSVALRKIQLYCDSMETNNHLYLRNMALILAIGEVKIHNISYCMSNFWVRKSTSISTRMPINENHQTSIIIVL